VARKGRRSSGQNPGESLLGVTKNYRKQNDCLKKTPRVRCLLSPTEEDGAGSMDRGTLRGGGLSLEDAGV